jgi:superfamily II helicase
MTHPFKFTLDPFQEEAISYIAKDENVLITAKTGSGKTLVGEYRFGVLSKKVSVSFIPLPSSLFRTKSFTT